MLSVQQLTKRYPGATSAIISDLELHAPSGISLSIQGASGCGKSTLLALLAGFEVCDSGSIVIANQQLDGLSASAADDFRKNNLGVIFQNYNLLECFNVWDNVAFTARLKGNYSAERQQQLLAQLGLSAFSQAPVGQLSGGEQQRVAIARALNHCPAVVLADEPTGNLDEQTSDVVSDLLFNYCHAQKITLVVVTHSSDVACRARQQYALHHGKLCAA
ncbi:ABC transporter ATP-binding protein [Alteromonas gilva]|uniref:ATP-binding cassette domain-containing protein n=1 Tax=Alteromonas gilva TaxID=2987522 RepID=A0ABT5L358_9ALTE|nr:ATP-binding cassette domain-containing protein [Alteromonas gilva]MDC8831483.1 ATP-binding cassette domain-containing protein [Alteromonas gilva]